ncbi:hypothetical protein F4782DRAFT_90820 [Xylaria castorea]|nr:hypothetical protein F4782DRAFT_90820 [Xylaria castorea]
MMSSVYHLRPKLVGRVKFACCLMPIGTLCRPLRRYSSRKSTSGPPTQSSIWTSKGGTLAAIQLDDKSGGLSFETEDETQWGNLLHYLWLRDNCRCSVCVNQDTRQRNFNTFELPVDIKPTWMTADAAGLKIRWSHDSHSSFYSWDFLEPYIKEGRPEPEDVQIQYFGAECHPNSRIEYDEFEKDETRAVGRLTDTIYGYHLLHRPRWAASLSSALTYRLQFAEGLRAKPRRTILTC